MKLRQVGTDPNHPCKIKTRPMRVLWQQPTLSAHCWCTMPPLQTVPGLGVWMDSLVTRALAGWTRVAPADSECRVWVGALSWQLCCCVGFWQQWLTQVHIKGYREMLRPVQTQWGKWCGKWCYTAPSCQAPLAVWFSLGVSPCLALHSRAPHTLQ